MYKKDLKEVESFNSNTTITVIEDRSQLHSALNEEDGQPPVHIFFILGKLFLTLTQLA